MERKMSRRTLLRNTAAITTGVVAARTVTVGAADDTPPEPTAVVPDHDPATGEILDRDRHHRWETM